MENNNTKPVGRAGKTQGRPVRVQLTIPEELNAALASFQAAQKAERGGAPDSKAAIVIQALHEYLAARMANLADVRRIATLAVLALASGCDRGALSGFVSMLFAGTACYVIGMFLINFGKKQDDETNY